MTARAVLIGSETYGLAGCESDVELIDVALTGRGFETTCLTGQRATRQSVLGALQTLVADSGPGDAAVIYFSGHGGRLARPDADERKLASRDPFFQFIVPTDMEKSTPGDFRGILSEELTIVQRQLVDAFDGAPVNATTVLDCCHSGYMARSATARPRSIDLTAQESRMFTIPGILDHVRALGVEADTGFGSTNSQVVRLVACQAEQSAFELPAVRGGTHGVFTDALVSVFDDIGDAAVSWAMVGDMVRRRVRSIVPEQRPEVEGPADRTVFDSTMLAPTSLPLIEVDGRLAVAAAPLLGVREGDTVRLVSIGSDDPGRVATVVDVRTGNAVLDLDPAELDGRVPVTFAIPERISMPPAGVGVGDGADQSLIVDAVEASPRLTARADHPIVRVDPVGEEWQVADPTGIPWRSDLHAADAAGLSQLVDTAEAIAVGHRLLDIADGTGASALPSDVEIEFGKFDGAASTPLDAHGERIAVGTPVTLRLHNNAPEERFIWLFDVGVSGRSALVTRAAPSGTRLGPVGDDDDSVDVWAAEGQPLFWPDDVPIDPHGRAETFVVIVADRRNDLSALASHEPTARGATRSPLDRLLDEARTGTRDVSPADEVDVIRFRLDRVEFVLVPTT